MCAADLDAVLIIEQESFPVPWIREHFEQEINAPHSYPFVAEINDVVVGYVCLTSLFEEAQILDIAIASEQRERGMAQKLMAHAVSVSQDKEAEVLALEVRASNSAAIALYEKLGFERTGVRINYYEGKDDAVLMEKKIYKQDRKVR
jgi:ribosomal-protein-alanine N-acetyltransferase